MTSVIFPSPIEVLSVLLWILAVIEGVNRNRTRGGDSKAAWSSRMRLVDPFTRKVPCTSVAARQELLRHDSRIWIRRAVLFKIQTTNLCIRNVNQKGYRCSPFGHDYGDISPYIKSAIGVGGGYLDIGVFETLLQ